MTGQRGFTLIELMIVIGIIAIIASIAIPNLLSAKLSANETAAIATLRAISSAQAQFQTTGKADTDSDGVGTYGSILELSAAIDVREGLPEAVPPIRPAVLSQSFRVVNGNGETSRSGYFFKMFLPEFDGVGVSPDDTGSFATVDEDLAETTWCCYAWPVNSEQQRNPDLLHQPEGRHHRHRPRRLQRLRNGPPGGRGVRPGRPRGLHHRHCRRRYCRSRHERLEAGPVERPGLRPTSVLPRPQILYHRFLARRPGQGGMMMTAGDPTQDPVFLGNLLDSLKHPFVFVDRDHVIRYVNRAAVEQHKEGEALIGQSIFDCHNEESCRMIHDVFAALDAGEDERLITDDEKHCIHMRAVRDGGGRLIGYYERYEPPRG